MNASLITLKASMRSSQHSILTTTQASPLALSLERPDEEAIAEGGNKAETAGIEIETKDKDSPRHLPITDSYSKIY